MLKDDDCLKSRAEGLERRLREAEQEVSYYKTIAETAGVARLQETEALSQMLVERTRIEEELRQHREHLEELVERRTVELSRAVSETKQLNAQLQQEVRERKRVEEAIRESEERFRALAQNSPDVIMRFDPEFRHLYVNPIVQATTGIPNQDFIGKTHRELGFPPGLIDLWEEAIQRVFESRKAHRVEFQLPSEVWIDWLLFPEFDPRDEVRAVLTTARDITAYKKIEETLRQEILERQQSEEKRRYLEAQLRQTQKIEALGRLAGGIAHDFNNILGIILGHVEYLLQDTPEESEEWTSLETVRRTGERAAELIRQILLFSRRQEHHMASTDLSQVIDETLALIRATIPSSINTHFHIQPHCRPILADASQVQQVIVNLCVNASHAMQEQGGTLEVSLTESTISDEQAQELGLESGDYLKLTISDTGLGMSAQVREHIFEPFFTTKEVGEGSGLGLAVVHGIVTAHGGAITAESDVGHGATFAIFFPVIEEPVTLAHSEEAHVATKNGQGHILVVDDEVDLTKLYKMALEKSGFQVTACLNGKDALDIFSADPNGIDLVFTDQVMPELTGTQLSEQILKIRADTPIILATGYSEYVSEQNAADYGFSGLFMKPVDIRSLVPLIQRILAR